MATLGAMILGLACLFYGYCLVHFGRELVGSRNKMTCYGLSRANSSRRTPGPETTGNVVALRAPRVMAARTPIDSRFAPLERSEYANMILTLGKSRLTVLPSRTARLAEKRAAKG